MNSSDPTRREAARVAAIEAGFMARGDVWSKAMTCTIEAALDAYEQAMAGERDAECKQLVAELEADATMNEEIPIKTHLHHTASLERRAAAMLQALAVSAPLTRADVERVLLIAQREGTYWVETVWSRLTEGRA